MREATTTESGENHSLGRDCCENGCTVMHSPCCWRLDKPRRQHHGDHQGAAGVAAALCLVRRSRSRANLNLVFWKYQHFILNLRVLNLVRFDDEVIHGCEVKQDCVLTKNNLYGTNLLFIRFHPKKVPILTPMVEHHQNTPNRCYIYQKNRHEP